MKKILVYVCVIFLSLYMIDMGSFGYYYKLVGSDTMHYSSGHGTGALVVALTTGTLLLVFFYLFQKRRIPIDGLVPIFVFVFVVLIYIVVTLFISGASELLAGTASCYSYLIIIVVVLGTDDDIWQLAKTPMIIIGSCCMIAAFAYSLSFLMNYSGYIGNAPQIIYLSGGFFPLAIYGMCYRHEKVFERVIVYISISLAIIVSVIYGTRGWLIQSAVFLIVFVFKSNNERIEKKRVSKIVISIVTGSLLIFASYYIVTKYFDTRLDYLIGRAFQNTRTSQYEEIFNQMTLTNFIFGSGQEATYASSLYGDYRFIDNTFVYLLFHFGIFFALFYLFCLLKGFMSSIKIKNYNASVVIVMWIFALCGLSVYFVPQIDVKCFFMYLLIGHCINESVSISRT